MSLLARDTFSNNRPNTQGAASTFSARADAYVPNVRDGSTISLKATS
jgi:hypothetical protein